MSRALSVLMISWLVPGISFAQLSSENFSMDVTSVGVAEFGGASSETFSITNAPDVELTVSQSDTDNGPRLLGRRPAAEDGGGTSTYLYNPTDQSLPDEPASTDRTPAFLDSADSPTQSSGGRQNPLSANEATHGEAGVENGASSTMPINTTDTDSVLVDEVSRPMADRSAVTAPQLQPRNYLQYGIIAGGVLLLIVFVLFLLRRSRQTSTE